MIITDPSEAEKRESERQVSVIPGSIRKIKELNISAGVENCGDENSYLETLKIYAEMVDEYADKVIEQETFKDMGVTNE